MTTNRSQSSTQAESQAETKQTIQENFNPLLDLLNGFECPILKNVMTDPVIASDGHSYERIAIAEWTRISRTSPMTRERLNIKLIPNRNLRKAIQDFLQRMPELGATLQAQRDLTLALRLCQEDLTAQEAKHAQEEDQTVAHRAAIDPLQLALGRKTILFIDAMSLHIRATPHVIGVSTLSEAESISKAITYASTVIRALSKGAEGYNALLDNPENYAIPKPFVENFVVPYVRYHGLLALMSHAGFARQLSIDLSHAVQPNRPAGKKDLAAIRIDYTQASNVESSNVINNASDLPANQSSSSRPSEQTTSTPMATVTTTATTSLSPTTHPAPRAGTKRYTLSPPSRPTTHTTLFATSFSTSSNTVSNQSQTNTNTRGETSTSSTSVRRSGPTA